MNDPYDPYEGALPGWRTFASIFAVAIAAGFSMATIIHHDRAQAPTQESNPMDQPITLRNPSVGDRGQFWPGRPGELNQSAEDQPMAAVVILLQPEGRVRLAVTDHQGRTHTRDDVRTVADKSGAASYEDCFVLAEKP